MAVSILRRDGNLILQVMPTNSSVDHDAAALRALSSPLRLQIILELAKAPRTMVEIHSVMRRSGYHRYPESTYRALETLCSTGLVKKTYDPRRKRLVYEVVLSSG